MIRPAMSSSSLSSTKSTHAVKKVDCGKPKRSLTAYNIFFKEQRQQIVSQGKSGGFAALARTIAFRWKNISEAELQACHQKAANDKLRYQQEMVAWSAQNPSGKPDSASTGPKVSATRNASFSSGTEESSDITGILLQKPFLEKRSLSTGSRPQLPASKAASNETMSLEDLIALRVHNQARSLFQEQNAQTERMIGEQTVTDNLLDPLFMEQLEAARGESSTLRQPSARRASTPSPLRQVFDDAWLEPNWNFDLDGTTGDLFARMLES